MTGEGYNTVDTVLLFCENIVEQINFCVELNLGCQSNSISVALKERNWQKSDME